MWKNKEANTRRQISSGWFVFCRLLFHLHLYFIFYFFPISLPPVIFIIFRWHSCHSMGVYVCVCIGGVCALRVFSVTPISLHPSHLAAGKASGLPICSIVSLHSPLKGFDDGASAQVHSPMTHRGYNPIIYFQGVF